MDVVQIITQVGFPIFCVLALGWFIRNVYDMMVQKSGEREERLYQVIVDAQAQNQQLAATNAEFAEVLRAYKEDLYNTIYYAALTIVTTIIWAVYMIKESLF